MEGFSVGEPVRGECSLCVLTNQFLKYMAASSDKTVDLKQAAIDLQVRFRSMYKTPSLHASWRCVKRRPETIACTCCPFWKGLAFRI
jgi:hypothetical protein